MERPNFYLLLELPLEKCEHNETALTTAIQHKKHTWNAQRNHPRYGPKMQQQIGYLNDIERVMRDPVLREQEYQAAIQASRAQEKAEFEALDRMLHILSQPGYLYEDDLQQLCREFPGLPKAVIQQRIQVPLHKREAQTTPEQKLDAILFRKIQDTCHLLGKQNLYDVLTLPPSCSCLQLLKAADQLYQEYSYKAEKTAEVTAFVEISGLCKTVFTHESEKKRYDYSLQLSQLEVLHPELKAAGLRGQISAEHFDLIVSKAGELGIGPEIAKAYLIDYAQKKKWFISVPAQMTAETSPRCLACGVVNRKGAQVCQHCRFPLQVTCPRCKTPCVTAQTRCDHCGFALGDMPVALHLLTETRQALQKGALKKAQETLQEAQALWPEHPDLSSLQQALKAGQKTLEETQKQLQAACQAAHYYKARQLLLQLRQMAPEHDSDSSFEQQMHPIQTRIQEAENWVQKAHHQSAENARSSYHQALKICQDAQAARDGLARFPPAPPQQLQAEARADGIFLSWQASASPGSVSYRVVRKSGAPVRHAEDGEQIQNGPQTTCLDPDCEAGKPYFYAVFSLRDQVLSANALHSETLLLLAEVHDLSVCPDDGQVALHWRLPAAAQGVQVWRSLHPSFSQALALKNIRSDGICDSEIRNGQTYHYLIQVQYRSPTGQMLNSQGLTLEASPAAPPEPVKDLEARLLKTPHWCLHWTPPPTGQLVIYQTQTPPALHQGMYWPLSQLHELGQALQVKTKLSQVNCDLHFQGLLTLIPVTLQASMAVIGQPLTLCSLSEVQSLQARLHNGNIYVEWDWPEKIQQVWVLYRHDGFPTGPEDLQATSHLLTLAQYRHEQAWVIRAPKPETYYFSIHSLLTDPQGQRQFAQGTRCKLEFHPPIEIRYAVRLKKNLLGRPTQAELVLQTEHPEPIRLPPLRLLKKPHNTPINSRDGESIGYYEQLQISQRQPLRLPLDTQTLDPKAYVRLFLEDEHLTSRYRLMAAGRDHLKLG